MIIITKFICPTDRKGARISVKSAGVKSKIVSYNHCKNIEENHKSAASALLDEGDKVLLTYYIEKIGYLHITGNKFQAKYTLEQIQEAMK